MFDIGFSEVLLIFVIALVVLGPEKLPRLASQVGRWIGRARGMARQFREQLEEEVNLEQVRKAHEQKPKATTTGDASPPGAQTVGAGETASPGQQAPGAGETASPEDQAPGSGEATSPSVSGTAPSETVHGADQHGSVPEGGQSQPQLSETSASSSAYSGPDPADFRADTFSHAHPTNEYGANPYTSNGAAEELQAAQRARAAGASPQTASEADVAAAQPQSEAEVGKRRATDEAYAAAKPRDNTPGTDNHGN
jgi:sec-independent protein translocase protein TatB